MPLCGRGGRFFFFVPALGGGFFGYPRGFFLG